MSEQLRAIREVPLPRDRQGRRRDEVLPRVFLGQPGEQQLEPLERGGIAVLRDKRTRRGFIANHAAARSSLRA